MIHAKVWLIIASLILTSSCILSKSIDDKNTSDDSSASSSSSSSSSEEKTTVDDLSSTTIEPDDTTTTEKLNQYNGEAKLPIDLLSEDILLDPNIVLARLSKRDVNLANWNYQQKQYGSWNSYRTNPVVKRRYTNDFDDKSNQYRKKIKIYPIFPGK